MLIKRLLVTFAILVTGVQIVRSAVVSALAEREPASAATFWSDHPAVERASAMTAIAAATRAGKSVPASAFAALNIAAVQAPLAPEPFLVRGVQANLSGNSAAAIEAFRAAEWRDIRSLPAHYFLTEAYLRTGKVREGLLEFAIVARLAPDAPGYVAPFLASFARDHHNWPELRELFRSDPKLEDATLVALAQDPSNTDSVLALASPDRRQISSNWSGPLLNGLIARGEFAKARVIWAELAGVQLTPDLLLSDPQFHRAQSQAPFDWKLTSSSLGVAEPKPGGQLHVLYYGDDNGVLAAQMLVLPPGGYRLTHKVLSGASHAEALSWAVQCARTGRTIATGSIVQTAGAGFTFAVPSDCGAVTLQLAGSASDMPRQSDVTISSLHLVRGEPR